MQRKTNEMERQQNGMEGNGMEWEATGWNGRQRDGMEGKTDARLITYVRTAQEQTRGTATISN